jgi:hypothetical protein
MPCAHGTWARPSCTWTWSVEGPRRHRTRIRARPQCATMTNPTLVSAGPLRAHVREVGLNQHDRQAEREQRHTRRARGPTPETRRARPAPAPLAVRRRSARRHRCQVGPGPSRARSPWNDRHRGDSGPRARAVGGGCGAILRGPEHRSAPFSVSEEAGLSRSSRSPRPITAQGAERSRQAADEASLEARARERPLGVVDGDPGRSGDGRGGGPEAEGGTEFRTGRSRHGGEENRPRAARPSAVGRGTIPAD